MKKKLLMTLKNNLVKFLKNLIKKWWKNELKYLKQWSNNWLKNNQDLIAKILNAGNDFFMKK